MATYIGLLRKEPDTCYGVDFPDFPGCITAGETIDEAYRKAQEVLPFHVSGMIEDGEAVPEPSSLEAVMADPENHDAVPFLVVLKPQRVKSIRISVTIEEPLVAEIDAATSNRSAFLAEGARLLLRQRH